MEDQVLGQGNRGVVKFQKLPSNLIWLTAENTQKARRCGMRSINS